MHSVTISYHDLAGKRRMRVSSSEENIYPVDAYTLTPHGLYFRIYSDQGSWRMMQAHVLPELHLQIVRFDWRNGISCDYDYYLDIVRVVEQDSRWVVRDLYLDVIVYEGCKATVLDTDEYLAALREGHLEPDEAEHALTVTHDTLNALAEHSYALEPYLASRGITLTWT
ncbi:DUF402 domain-containing protein [soil metagenome]